MTANGGKLRREDPVPDPFREVDGGARLVTLPGSHWWPVQFPVEAAAYLEAFWASV